MSRRNDREESTEELSSLSADQIEERSWKAADKLINTLEDFNGERSEDHDALSEYFASQCVSLLMERHSVSQPAVLSE